MIAWPAKDPADVADFTWTPDLDQGDHIASFVATITSGTITKHRPDTFSNSQGTSWFDGGADNELAMITLDVTTQAGRTFRDGAVLPVFSRATEALAIFRLRYPAFSAISDGVISYRLFDAGLEIGANWPESDAMSARVALAAHKLAEAGAVAGAIPPGVTSFRSGSFSATVSDAMASMTGLNATVYGREFLALRRRAFAGPRLSWMPTAAAC